MAAIGRTADCRPAARLVLAAAALLLIDWLVSGRPVHADSVYALLDCSVSRWNPCRNERGDMAERVRLQNRSGRRIRAQKYPGGAGSFNLVHVRPKVRFRGTADAGSTLSAQAAYRRRRSRRQFQNLVKAPALLFHFGVQRHSLFRSRCATCIRQWRSIGRVGRYCRRFRPTP